MSNFTFSLFCMINFLRFDTKNVEIGKILIDCRPFANLDKLCTYKTPINFIDQTFYTRSRKTDLHFDFLIKFPTV